MRDVDYHVRYNQVWKLERSQIDAHMAQWDQPGYMMPYAIANWPGNGDTNNGEPVGLAPFSDLDQDGLYEPGQGDYPLIRGDMAVYVIVNATIGADNKADIHLMHYAYDAPDNDALDNTVFTQLRVVERSGRDHDDLHVALFADFDIGCGANDFAECDPALDLFFAYNGVATDDPCFGALGYEDNTPAQGVAFLSSPLRSHRTWNNAELVNPSDAIQGLQNGQPFDYGAGPTNFQFPGAPSTEVELGNLPGDRRSVGATTPSAWNAGEALCYDMAFVFGQRNLISDPSAIDILKSRTTAVRDWYAQQDFSCPENITVNVEHAAALDHTLRLYPNPSNGQVLLQRSEATLAAEVVLRDAAGAVVFQSNWPGGAPMHLLDIQALVDGLYFVEVSDRNGRQQQRLVKTGH